MDRGKIITVDSWIFNWDFWLIMYWDNFFVFYSESSNHKFMLEFNILVWNSNFELPLLWFLLRIMFGHYFGCSHLPGTPLNPPWNLAESWFHVSFCGHWPYLFSNNNRLVVPGLMLVHLQPIPNAEHHFSRFWRLDHCRMAEQLLPYQGAMQGPISVTRLAAAARQARASPALQARKAVWSSRLTDCSGPWCWAPQRLRLKACQAACNTELAIPWWWAQFVDSPHPKCYAKLSENSGSPHSDRLLVSDQKFYEQSIWSLSH